MKIKKMHQSKWDLKFKIYFNLIILKYLYLSMNFN